MFTRTGYASTSAEAPLSPFAWRRRDPGPSEIGMIPVDRIETACRRMPKSDVKYCLVIDMASLPEAA